MSAVSRKMLPHRFTAVSTMLLLLASCMVACERKPATSSSVIKRNPNDTLTFTYEELVKLLPELPEYEPESAPNGEYLSGATSGGKLSFAKQIFLKNNERVYVEIIDYKNAPDSYKAMMEMYGINSPSENSFEKTEKITAPVPETEALAKTKKENAQVQLTYGIKNRIMINVIGDNEAANIQKLQQIAARIPMDSIRLKIDKEQL